MTLSLNLPIRTTLIFATLFQIVALLLMAFDPTPHGFGFMTLWIAPPLLIIGLLLPALAFTEIRDYSIKRSWKTIGGIVSFLIALITYTLTLEPTASLWDCSETIAAAYKLQVPHTPGTPLTILLGRLFSMLALDNTTMVAWWINFMVGFFSSLAVLLSYLITWHFGERIVKSQILLTAGSLIGALCLTFSDSFWFSAVEAETYGPSMFFMLLLLWLSISAAKLKEPLRNKRLLLISYLMGLSYCIHPMCILILPVCFLVWIESNAGNTWRKQLLAFSVGTICVLFISRVYAVHIFEWAFGLDLFLTNSFSLPLYSGAFLLLFLILSISWAIHKRYKKARLPLTASLLILLGFSPYIMLFIRSAQMPPINEFSPSNLAKIKPYMNRENYPSRPLLFGPYYDAEIQAVENKGDVYVEENSGYKKVGTIPGYKYERSQQTILPRIYSNEPSHVKTYQEWTGLKAGEKPKFSDNLKFLFSYQLGHMYFRYLLWNFAGRTGDIQHADWMKPWDNMLSRDSLAYNRAINQYFMAPFLIGLIGFIWQYRKDRNGFITTLAFFAITGFLLAVYLNGTPNEPRERDYIYVGSYVAFSLWIGLGLMATFSKIKKHHLIWVGLIVPIWMLYQNLDDHDRSGRTFQMDYARSVLASCEKNAVLFTGGDNDTFPLWYLQDVEGFRTDVRVKVLSYFNADWYINQLSRQYYDSPEMHLTLRKGINEYGPHEAVYVNPQTEKAISWQKFMEAINKENSAVMMKNKGNSYAVLPSNKIQIQNDQLNMVLNINGRYIPKNELAILDLIQSNSDRPVYFNFTALNGLKTNLRAYVRQEGQVYRLTNEKHPEASIPVDLEKSYESLIKNMDYSNLNDPSVYFNFEDFIARMINPLRFNVNRLIQSYLAEDRLEEAKQTMRFAKDKLYQDHLMPSYADLLLGTMYEQVKELEEAKKLYDRVFIFFYEKIELNIRLNNTYDVNDIYVLQEATRLSQNQEYKELFNNLAPKIETMR